MVESGRHQSQTKGELVSNDQLKRTFFKFQGIMSVYIFVFSILSSLKIVGATDAATWSWWKILYLPLIPQGIYFLILIAIGVAGLALGAIGVIVKEIIEK